MEKLVDFYRKVQRKQSREESFGSGWRSAGAPGFHFSVFWIADTNELCVQRSPAKDVQEDGVFRRFILDIPPHFKQNPLSDDEVTVKVLCRLDEEGVSKVLEGWEDQLGAPDGLSWLVSRAAESET